MLHNVEGPCNILANYLLRLYHLVTPAQIAEGRKLVLPTEVSNQEEDEAYFLDQEYSGLYYNDNEVWECVKCYLNLPKTPHPDQSLLNYAHIRELQQQDEQLFALQVRYPDNYNNYNVNDIICSKKHSGRDDSILSAKLIRIAPETSSF